MTSHMSYQITSIGAPIEELLAQSGRVGTVFAVFRRSCYLESGSGQVFCLADQQLGEGPLTMRVELSSNTTLGDLGITEGCHLERDGVDLRLGRASFFTTAETAIWEPDPIGKMALPGEILRRLDTLVNRVGLLSPPDGLGDIIPHAADLANGDLLSFDSINTTAGLAMPRLRRLSEGLAHSGLEAIDQAVAGLLGLGPGLTPSGDDLLGGMLVALRGMPDAASHPSVDALAACVTRYAAVKTNRISSAMLEQSAQGYSSAAQHDLLRCLLGAQSRPGTSKTALDLVRTGHTSGWDALAGILLGVCCGLRIGRAQTPYYSLLQHSIASGLNPAGAPV